MTTAPEEPTDKEAGSRDEIPGTGFVMRKLEGEELPPPGAAFTTVNGYDPAVAASAAERVNEISVGLTYAVGRAAPLNMAVVFEENPLPVIVTATVPLPAKADAGDVWESTGRGLSTSSVPWAPASTPWSDAVTGTMAPVENWVEGTVTVSCVPLTYVVGTLVESTRTVVPLWKPVPYTVRVAAVATGIRAGDTELTVRADAVVALTCVDFADEGLDPQPAKSAAVPAANAAAMTLPFMDGQNTSRVSLIDYN